MAPAPCVEAVALAAACADLEHALSTAAQRVHASWRPALERRWPFLGGIDDDAARARLLARALAGRVGLPEPQLVAAPDGRLACAGPEVRMRSLCMLSLACRPGVLRCCVERHARVALSQALGEAAGPLAVLAEGGRAVPHRVAAWTPLHWACIGFLDWLALPAGRDRLLRRLLVLSLPNGLLGMARRSRLAPRDLEPAAAVQALERAGGRWPC